MRRTRKHALLRVLLLALPLQAAAAAPARPANLILISVDTLRADHLGCYGYARPTSPRLDRLAREGVTFADVSAPSPWTRPSHASLLTGRYPSRHGVRLPAHALKDDVPTLAGWLSGAGWETMAIVNSEHLDRPFGLARGFERFHYESEWSGWPWKRLTDSAEKITTRAIAWLATSRERRFFLFVHYYDPHSDYDPKPEMRRLFVGPYGGPYDGATGPLLEAQQGTRPIAAADARHLADLYDGEIRQLDAQLGRLFDFLDRSGLAADTLVVLTSDHGEEFLEHGSVLHGRAMYQEIVGVPWILRGPGVPASRRVNAVASLVDVAPTSLALLGAPPLPGVDGVDLSGAWGSDFQVERAIFAEADQKNAEPDVKRMVRRGRWKLHHDRRTKNSELYDLSADPGETHDRAAIEPGRTRALLADLEEFMRGERKISESIGIDPESRERLRRLGYGAN